MALIDSPARGKLNDWLEAETGRSQAKTAAFLGVSAPSVHAWRRGISRPEQHYRLALEALTGIPATDWETDDERQKREAALGRIAAKNDVAPSDETVPAPTGTDGE